MKAKILEETPPCPTSVKKLNVYSELIMWPSLMIANGDKDSFTLEQRPSYILDRFHSIE